MIYKVIFRGLLYNITSVQLFLNYLSTRRLYDKVIDTDMYYYMFASPEVHL